MTHEHEDPTHDPSLSPVQRLLLEVLAQGGSDMPAALAACCSAHPEHADELRRRVEWLASTGLLESTRDAAEPGVPERLGEFQLLERIGGGGMGVVYRAHQSTLGRDVALKLVRPEQLIFAGARDRFRREVSSVARLNHPGIVPVHAVGEENGIPYFAMELVRGLTLAAALEALGDRDPATLHGRDLERVILDATEEERDGEPVSLFAGTWEETVLRIVRDVAEALEHAHRAGLVHRDVKPSNVMVTRAGRVMLVDFGLSSDARSDRLTRTGSQVGSLPYMSPEQLEGGAVDRRSDVYSLGVTIYELLSLRLPYAETTVLALTRLVLEGRTPALRALNPRVTWEAETVCLKALETDPRRRYSSAAEFAHDLGNVLERRPLLARRAGVLHRAKRWSQRNPGAATALVLAALLFVVAPASWAWRERATSRSLAQKGSELTLANAALQGSLETARSERERAEANYGDALAAIDRLLTRIADERLEHLPHLEVLRSDVYADALSFYERLESRRRDDPALRLELARARTRMAYVQQLLGRPSELHESLGEAIAILEELGAEDPDNEMLRAELGRALLQRVQAQDSLGRRDEQAATAQRALTLFDELVAAHPDVAAHQDGRARAARALARAQSAVGRRAEAVEILRAAILAFESSASAASAEGPLLLATLLEDRARILLSEGRLDEAQEDLERALVLAAGSARERADHPEFRTLEMNLLHSRAMAAVAEGDHAAALEHWDRQIELVEGLSRQFPAAHHYPCFLVKAVQNRAIPLMHTKRFAEAAETFRRAIGMAQVIAERLPDEPIHAYQLATTRKNLGEALMRQQQFAEAAEVLELALPPLDAHVAAYPGDTAAWFACASGHLCRAEVLVGLGDHGAAVDELRSVRRFRPNASLRFNVVIVFARCVDLAVADETLLPADRAALASAYEQELLEALRYAVDGGFRDRAWLERVSALDRVRGRPEFEEIVRPLR